ncbi:hypothetical protein [Clostridium saccharobutylicum]|uniref:Uncharacterized protein n=1 Tax=Clostridium saccharobutylicum TaxID=169679 RepID=A0A1S8MYT7_CLOSA|nr:hypothetical protein [Clostridium saccharobutylicum]OOM09325.1 hypothetical protein CLOSAC_36060 [Clostridium saccharobutylicum]
MNIILLSFMEAIIVSILGLIIFIGVLCMPRKGIVIHKEFRVDSEGFCLKIERQKEKNS